MNDIAKALGLDEATAAYISALVESAPPPPPEAVALFAHVLRPTKTTDANPASDAA